MYFAECGYLGTIQFLWETGGIRWMEGGGGMTIKKPTKGDNAKKKNICSKGA